MKTTELE